MIKDVNFMPSKKEKSLIISLNSKIYPFEIILGAAYSFIDRAYVFLDGDPNKNIKISFKSKERDSNLKKISGDFQNELLNQSLRKQISDSNKVIREYIVANAILGSMTPKSDVQKCSSENIVDKAKTNKDDMGLELEKDKDLLKELKKLEKEFSGSDVNFDFNDDKMGIAMSWEDKYGKNKKDK